MRACMHAPEAAETRWQARASGPLGALRSYLCAMPPTRQLPVGLGANAVLDCNALVQAPASGLRTTCCQRRRGPRSGRPKRASTPAKPASRKRATTRGAAMQPAALLTPRTSDLQGPSSQRWQSLLASAAVPGRAWSAITQEGSARGVSSISPTRIATCQCCQRTCWPMSCLIGAAS